MSSIQVDTQSYEGAHGRKPRGHGYWFFTGRNRHGQDVDGYSGEDSYGNVKRTALRQARERNHMYTSMDRESREAGVVTVIELEP